MTAKKIIQDFYKSDAFINVTEMESFLHPDFLLEWHSSLGFRKLNKHEVLDLTKEMGASYVRTKVRIHSLIQEMLLAHFFVIWELQDAKLYRCYQMSQLS